MSQLQDCDQYFRFFFHSELEVCIIVIVIEGTAALFLQSCIIRAGDDLINKFSQLSVGLSIYSTLFTGAIQGRESFTLALAIIMEEMKIRDTMEWGKWHPKWADTISIPK